MAFLQGFWVIASGMGPASRNASSDYPETMKMSTKRKTASRTVLPLGGGSCWSTGVSVSGVEWPSGMKA